MVLVMLCMKKHASFCYWLAHSPSISREGYSSSHRTFGDGDSANLQIQTSKDDLLLLRSFASKPAAAS